MNIQHDDLPDVSDSSDEDYDPGIKEEEVSEVDSDGDEEEPLSENEASKPKSKRTKKGKTKTKNRAPKEINESGEFVIFLTEMKLLIYCFFIN